MNCAPTSSISSRYFGNCHNALMMSEAISKEFAIGERVELISQPAYFKTADSMPMLRPPNVVHIGEQGIVLDRRPGGYWAVRFERGAYLVDAQHLQSIVYGESTSKDG